MRKINLVCFRTPNKRAWLSARADALRWLSEGREPPSPFEVRIGIPRLRADLA